MCRNINQSGKRPGSVAVYLELWHRDIEDFLKIKTQGGMDENLKSRDLFQALWCNNLFFERLLKNGTWSLMESNLCTDLSILYGEEFKIRYKFGEFDRLVL